MVETRPRANGFQQTRGRQPARCGCSPRLEPESLWLHRTATCFRGQYYEYSPFQVLCPTRNFFFQNFPNCELLSGAGTGRPARTAGFQVSRAGAFRRVPVSFKYLQWLQAGRARSVPPYGRHRVFVEGGSPMPQVPSGRQGVASSCRICLRSTIRSSASS